MPCFVLKIDDLCKNYHGTVSVWRGLNLTVRAGEVYGLLGPNGVGKTTLIKIITGVLPYDSGRVELFDEPVLPQGNRLSQSRIGIVPQEITLYEELTAEENLMFWGGIMGMRRSYLKTRIKELFLLFNFEQHKNTSVFKFSGGMKRCVNLMVGILNEPDFLLLDEPTVGIDVQTKQLIRNIIMSMNNNGTTIFYTSHDMAEAETICTRIGIVNKGGLIAEGSPEELKQTYSQAGKLEDVYLNLIEKDETA